jgi:hypothetical protein
MRDVQMELVCVKESEENGKAAVVPAADSSS